MAEQRVLTDRPADVPMLDGKALIGAITRFLANQEPANLDRIRRALEAALAAAAPEAVLALNQRLARAGADWDYYPPDPLARRIHQVVADTILADSVLVGGEHAAAAAGRPVVIFANHLSYSDANLLDVLLVRGGAGELADRLTVIAGPKVYSSLKRRFSSLCFGTIKTPQSSSLSSEDAVMNPREVARAARRCIEIAHERLERGDALLVFGEGTRSRTRGMQPMLPGVSRYLDGPESLVVPAGITGSESMFPIGEDALYAVHIEASVGPPIEAAALRAGAGGDRRLMMDVVGLAVAERLPPEYRGAYAGTAPDLDEARALLARLRR